jgi:uncharacterized Fe-S center protein
MAVFSNRTIGNQGYLNIVQNLSVDAQDCNPESDDELVKILMADS